METDKRLEVEVRNDKGQQKAGLGFDAQLTQSIDSHSDGSFTINVIDSDVSNRPTLVSDNVRKSSQSPTRLHNNKLKTSL